ncbi:MAG: translocation/assembly module TamB, partial [Spirochaetaceae bacterium]|nr:translocation/assembly module TamB [Spirochaetaceae bacterium]
TVTGDLTANEAEITLNADELSGASPIPDTLDGSIEQVVELIVRAGRKLEFIWPNAEWPIIQTNLEMGNSVRITSSSLTHRYSIVGDVNLRRGEIFYFERSFYIREGRLSLNENENKFAPRLSARAEVRDQISTGPVTLAMIIDDAPLESFTPRFESTPPLSQAEIISLLGQSLAGIPTEEGKEADPFTVVSSTADLLAQTQVYRRVQRGVRSFFPFLDMLSFRTQVLQNFLILEYRKRTEAYALETIGIGNYLDNTSVFIGKYITSDMFFQNMWSLRQSESNTEIQGLRLQSLVVESDFGLELRGPVFDIQLNVTLLHLEKLFVRNFVFSDFAYSVSVFRRSSSWYDMVSPFIYFFRLLKS